MYAARRSMRSLGDAKAWPYGQGKRRYISGLGRLGCAGCRSCAGGCKKAKGLGDWGDFIDQLPQLVTAGATGAASIIRAVDGSGSPVVLTAGGQTVSTQGLTPAQIQALQNTQQPSALSSISPTMWFAGGLLAVGALVLASR